MVWARHQMYRRVRAFVIVFWSLLCMFVVFGLDKFSVKVSPKTSFRSADRKLFSVLVGIYRLSGCQ